MTFATHSRRIALLTAMSSVLIACGGGGGGPVGNTGAGSMSATIDGTNWSSSAASAIATPGGIFTITGQQTATGTIVSMVLYHVGAT